MINDDPGVTSLVIIGDDPQFSIGVTFVDSFLRGDKVQNVWFVRLHERLEHGVNLLFILPRQPILKHKLPIRKWLSPRPYRSAECFDRVVLVVNRSPPHRSITALCQEIDELNEIEVNGRFG